MPFSDPARKYRTSDSIHSEDEEPLMDEEALLGSAAVSVKLLLEYHALSATST
jgi:hypothetical protein